MLLTDDRLIDAMRVFVTANNRFDFLVSKDDSDPRLVEAVAEERRQAGEALREALIQRGWRPSEY